MLNTIMENENNIMKPLAIAQINISKKIKYDAVKKYQPKNLLRISFLRHKTLMIKIWYNHFMFDK